MLLGPKRSHVPAFLTSLQHGIIDHNVVISGLSVVLWLMCGLDWNTASLTTPLTGDADPSMPVFERVHFYCATLCLSAVFAVARCPSVCPCVCLSVTLVYCIHTAKDNVKLISRPGSPIILVFWPQRRYPIPSGTLQRGRKIHGVGKFANFDWNRRLSRKRYE